MILTTLYLTRQYIKREINILSNPSNYRPVSLTVNLCKVLESIMRDKIMEHIQKHKLIKESQHGFVKGRSCLTNLLVFLEEVTNYN